jgi:hypothetical protein
MGYIYKITNTVNGKAYVGVTNVLDPTLRFKRHMQAIRRGKGCPLLMEAVKKYGEDAFKFEILIICFDEDIYKYENNYIIKHNTLTPNGYNAVEGGKAVKGFLGKTHSENTKMILGKKSKEINKRPEIKEMHRQCAFEMHKKYNMSELLKKSEKWHKAVAEGRIGNRGGKHNSHTTTKISEGVIKYFNDDDIRKKHSNIMRKVNGRKINQFSKEDILIAAYDSIIEATEKTKTHRSTIQACATGRTKTGGGFIWKYVETEPKESLSV